MLTISRRGAKIFDILFYVLPVSASLRQKPYAAIVFIVVVQKFHSLNNVFMQYAILSFHILNHVQMIYAKRKSEGNAIVFLALLISMQISVLDPATQLHSFNHPLDRDQVSRRTRINFIGLVRFVEIVERLRHFLV